MSKTKFIFSVGILFLMSSCFVKFKTIKSGHVGIKRTFGAYKEKTLEPGLKVYTFGTRLFQVDLTPRKFTTTLSTRLADGTRLTPEINVFLKINPDRILPLLKERYSGNSRKVNPLSFTPWVNSVLKESIALTSVKYASFEMVNINREQYEDFFEEEVSKKLKDLLLIDDIGIHTIKMNEDKANKLSEYSALRQELTNLDLEIELAQKEIILDSLRAISQKGKNVILQPTLTPEILEQQRIEQSNRTNGNGQTIIIND